MTAYYAATFIRQNGELFACTEDYDAENPNIFHLQEMLDFLQRTFLTKGAWRSTSGKRLNFGRYSSKKVAEMMIDGLGDVEELGIEGDMPVYMRVLPLASKGGFPDSVAEQFVEDNKIQAVISHHDPLFKGYLNLIGKKCKKSVLLYTNRDNKTVLMRLFQV